MAKRAFKDREPRQTGLLPVHIYGQNSKGDSIEQLACTLNLSTHGVRLVGLSQRLRVGSSLRLRYRQDEAHFEVVWTRKDKIKANWEAGLRCVEPTIACWSAELSAGVNPEDFRQLLKSVLADHQST